MPEASTTMSTPPKRCTAAATILSQCAAELGRKLTLSTLAPRFSHSAATLFRASVPPAAMTRLQPAPASTCAASAPNAPVAPVTIAVLPRTSNSDSGFFRTSSDMIFLANYTMVCPIELQSPFVPAQAGTQVPLAQTLRLQPWVPAFAGTNG